MAEAPRLWEIGVPVFTARLATERKGFPIDKGAPGKMGLYGKNRVVSGSGA